MRIRLLVIQLKRELLNLHQLELLELLLLEKTTLIGASSFSYRNWIVCHWCSRDCNCRSFNRANTNWRFCNWWSRRCSVCNSNGAKVVEDAIVGTVNIGDEAVSAGANVSSTGCLLTGSISSRLTTGTQDYTTFTITVASKASYDTGSYNAFYVNGVERPVLTLIEGQTYRFDQSDSSNSGHP